MWIDLFVHIVGIFAALSVVFAVFIIGLMIFDLVFKGPDESKD